ncbi:MULTISPECIES: hypothetical protein [unclassified Streptomyces]|uniref:hypothetical protein n=1 Tax=unclassified Streptomyces TaxID=2593676 RepID=UPI003369BEC2
MGKGMKLAAMAALVTGLAAVTTPVQANPKPTEKHCVIVVGKAPKGKMSPIEAKACGDSRSAAMKALGTKAAARTLLMDWFEHANNQPNSATSVYGSAGNCDSDGYRLRAEGFWANRISGFASYSNCNVVTGYDLANVSGDRATWGWNTPWVGSFMNDRIESFWIRA